jgi:hypothetical protein
MAPVHLIQRMCTTSFILHFSKAENSLGKLLLYKHVS